MGPINLHNRLDHNMVGWAHNVDRRSPHCICSNNCVDWGYSKMPYFHKDLGRIPVWRAKLKIKKQDWNEIAKHRSGMGSIPDRLVGLSTIPHRKHGYFEIIMVKWHELALRSSGWQQTLKNLLDARSRKFLVAGRGMKLNEMWMILVFEFCSVNYNSILRTWKVPFRDFLHY